MFSYLNPPTLRLPDVQGLAEQYNTDFPANRMDLVLFDDALRHLITVSRILGMPRGNMLFVGVGGSGKQSLTRLASYIAGNFTFQITITKAYNLNSFMDDMRCVGCCADTAACRGRRVCCCAVGSPMGRRRDNIVVTPPFLLYLTAGGYGVQVAICTGCGQNGTQ